MSEQTPQIETPTDNDTELVEELHNPYPASVYKHGQSNTIRLSYDVNKRDVLSLRVVMLDWGCLSTAVKLFIRHLYEYSKSNNLDLESRNQLIDHIRDICPVDVRSSGQPDPKGPNRDVGPGTGPVHSSDKGTPNKPATVKGKRPAASSG